MNKSNKYKIGFIVCILSIALIPNIIDLWQDHNSVTSELSTILLIFEVVIVCLPVPIDIGLVIIDTILYKKWHTLEKNKTSTTQDIQN